MSRLKTKISWKHINYAFDKLDTNLLKTGIRMKNFFMSLKTSP